MICLDGFCWFVIGIGVSFFGIGVIVFELKGRGEFEVRRVFFFIICFCKDFFYI